MIVKRFGHLLGEDEELLAELRKGVGR